MGAAWRNLKDSNINKITEMIKEVKQLGMESCVTLGMITGKQAEALKAAGVRLL